MTREELLQLIDKAADEGSTELDLAGLGLEELPPEIGKCTQLETLVLGKVNRWGGGADGKTTPKPTTNQLTSLPEELRSLLNLRSINLSGNPFGKMPELLLEMNQLESLNLTSIGLTEIPDSIGKLSNLTKLDLIYNPIAQIPDGLANLCEALAQLSNLTKLDLSYNEIAQIPEAIAQLSQLTELNLSCNQITEIPQAIVKLSNLTELELWRNQITKIPDEIAQLFNLTQLSLGSNHITEIPEAITQLFNLTQLKLSRNKITQIPDALANLCEAIVQLPNLTQLDLSYNKITQIPDGLAKLCEALAQLPNLTQLSLKGILTHADLSRILDLTKYPSHRYNCLTELMGEFQLCFPLSHCNAPTFLIPGILPKEEPENTKLEGETLEFQYHYRILPDSILSRFIVLMHEKIHNSTHWRTGVMLEYKEGAETYNIALIKSDPEDEKIFIAVSGRESTRRSFLSLIRDTFTKIHNSFANLEVSQWVPVPGYPDADPLDYEELLGLEDMGDTKVSIGKLKLKLDLRSLLDGYESIELRRIRQRGDEKYGREYDDILDIAKLAVSRPIINKAEAKMTQNSSETNNFQGAFQGANFSGNIGGSSNSAAVSGNQSVQNNNANTAEILKLISSMRETATQFPEDIREEIIIDLEDVEAEIKKPENERNPSKLKKRLTAIIAAATAIAIPIAGMTDFANTAIDVGNKLGIELKLPSAR